MTVIAPPEVVVKVVGVIPVIVGGFDANPNLVAAIFALEAISASTIVPSNTFAELTALSVIPFLVILVSAIILSFTIYNPS